MRTGLRIGIGHFAFNQLLFKLNFLLPHTLQCETMTNNEVKNYYTFQNYAALMGFFCINETNFCVKEFRGG